MKNWILTLVMTPIVLAMLAVVVPIVVFAYMLIIPSKIHWHLCEYDRKQREKEIFPERFTGDKK